MIWGYKGLRHHWFAWYPVQLECGRYAWLEMIEREYNSHVKYFVDYREIIK